jgi:hypothetical protein
VNKPKRKGTAWESAVRDYLIATGFTDAHRVALKGVNDEGDVMFRIGRLGEVKCVYECKNEKGIDLAAAVNEAEHEALNTDADYFAAIIKRRNHSTNAAYVVLPMWHYVAIMKDLQELFR